MSTVNYEARFTRNMGNYESLQLTIGVSDQPRGEETTSQAYNRVKDFVDSRLLDEISQLEKDINDARKAVKDHERERLVKVAAKQQELDESKDK